MNKNFDAQAYMNSLSPDMQNRIRSCKSAEEVEAILKQSSPVNGATELSMDELDNVTGGRSIVPVAMAAMMLFSSLAPLAASAEEPPSYTETQAPEESTEAETAAEEETGAEPDETIEVLKETFDAENATEADTELFATVTQAMADIRNANATTDPVELPDYSDQIIASAKEACGDTPLFQNEAFCGDAANRVPMYMPDGFISFSRENAVNSANALQGTSAEDFGKKAGIDLGDAALDTVGDLFPGAKLLVSPFKSLFHANVDDPDPMTMMNEKLNEMDNKLDEIQNRLGDLNDTINQNTEWMGQKMENVADMNAFKEDYRNLSALLEDFSNDIKAAETYPKCNNTQKIMRLAQLKKSANYRDINLLCNKIKKYMDGSNPNAYPCMYEVLYKSKALNYMTAGEAYNAAYPVAQDLTEQYVYAVLMLAECQRAADAVCRFTEEDVAELGNGEEKRYFDEFDQYRVSFDKDVASAQLVAAADGLEKFRAHDNGTMTFKEKKPGFLPAGSLQYGVNLYENRSSCVSRYTSQTTLSFAEIKELADYVRSNYPGTSLYAYLQKWNPGAVSSLPSDGTAYLLTSNDTRTNEKYNDWHGLGVFGGSKDYDCTVYAKGINIYDPEVKETEFEVFFYNRWDYYIYGIHCDTDYFSQTNTSNTLFYLMGSNFTENGTLSYRAHVENIGWMDTVPDSATAGTTGQSLRMEGVIINLNDKNGNSMISYRAHVQDDGWQDWHNSGELAGTVGQSKRLEALEIKLNAEYAEKYDIVYRVHMEGIGWGDWVKNGETAGTTGESRRVEAVEIKLVPLT